MMDKPTLAEIVTAVREFIETKAIPELTGHTAFHARVAANALAIAERELATGAATSQAELVRLKALLGRDGTLDQLNRALAARIASGDITLETPGLAAHLKATTLDKVAIDQPSYSGFKSAAAGGDRGDGV
jgi:seryl-tRNA(Sec) selenium transferase